MELVFAGPVPTAEFEALPGVSDVVADEHILRMRVSGNITDVVRTAAKYELSDFVSREPSLEETFLAEYGRSAEPAPWWPPDDCGIRFHNPDAAIAARTAVGPGQRLRQDDSRLPSRGNPRRRRCSDSCSSASAKPS